MKNTGNIITALSHLKTAQDKADFTAIKMKMEFDSRKILNQVKSHSVSRFILNKKIYLAEYCLQSTHIHAVMYQI